MVALIVPMALLSKDLMRTGLESNATRNSNTSGGNFGRTMAPLPTWMAETVRYMIKGMEDRLLE